MNVEKFVTKSLRLLEEEREAEIIETSHLHETTSSKELQRRGVCLVKLRIASQRSGLYGRTVLDFEAYWPGKQMPSHSLTPGDIVGLSLSQSDAVHDQEASGIVSRVSATAVSVAFEELHDTMGLDDQAQYKLLKLANDVTYKRIKNALQNLNAYHAGPGTNLIQTLFGETSPTPPCLEFVPELQFFNQGLDDSQKEAVKFALAQKELAIIHGPPGTGKTTTVVEIIRQAIQRKMKVLACAPSNIAVDNLVERLAASKTRVVRLGHPARLLHTIQRYSLDAILATSEETQLVGDVRRDIDQAMKKLKKLTDKGQRDKVQRELRYLRKELRQREEAAIKQVLRSAEVVLATLTGASDSGPTKFLEEEHFDLVVIDECSQALEAACWIALVKAPRCVLAGDHNQLPPTIICKRAAKDGLEVTLMERLLKLYEGEQVMRMLTMQYRMNQIIMQWASEQLYQGRLQAHHTVAQHLLRDLACVCDSEVTQIPMLLVDTAGCNLPELRLPEEVSKGNEGEADLVTLHVQKLVSSGLCVEDIAVIAPYNLQVELLRLRLSEQYPKLEIKSVDGFQGREKEAVVISLVRSNDRGEVGFLAENRRINVAITRARRHLAVICDSETVGHHAFLKSMIDYITEYGDVWSAEQYIEEGALKTNYPRPEFVEEQISQAVDAIAEAKTRSAGHGADKSKGGTKQHDRSQKQKYGPKAKQQDQKMQETKCSRTPAPAVAAAEVDDADAAREELRTALEEFYLDDKATTYSFSPSLSSRERFLVHEMAESLGLLHLSEGQDQHRHIVVTKPSTNKQCVPKPSSKESTNNENTIHFEAKDASRLMEHTPVVKKAKAENKSDITMCEQCRKLVPQMNFDLHVLRCPPLPRGNEQDTRAAGARPKSRKKKSTKSGKQEAEEDFDALIEEAINVNTSCHAKKCKASTATLGQNCEFCAQRFCLSHHIPEVHGCGDAARAKARATISREGVLHRGSGVPNKLPNPDKKAHLQRKLDKKLNQMSDARRAKKKEK